MNVSEAEDLNRYLPGSSSRDWLGPQNFSFHICMLLFTSAYLVPSTFKHYVITLRSLMTAALLVFMLWGALFWCTWDVIVWGTVFLIQNLILLVDAIYRMRKIKFPSDLEDLYMEVFSIFGISRSDFKGLVSQNCKWVNIFPGDKYAMENQTTVEARVSVLVSGTMRVSYEGNYLHDIKERQLIDSPEWEMTRLKRGEIFQVTIEAIDRCFYLCWNREKLQFYLQANPTLEAAFNYIRGKDVMGKVYQTALNASRRSQQQTGCDVIVDAIGIRNGLAGEDPSLIYE